MDRLRTTISPSLPSPPNPSLLFIHALLPLFLVLTTFGPGYQTISSFAILYFPLSVYYIRTCTRWWWIFLFYIMNSIGFMLAYMNTLNLGGDEASGSYKGMTFGIGLLVNLVNLIPYLFDRIAQRKFSSDGWARIMVFPCVWTGISTILLFSSPLGDWGNYAFILSNYEEILQLTSLAGLGGINFIISWCGPIGSDIISYHQNSLSSSASSTGSIIIDNQTSIEDNSTDTILRMSPTRPTRKSLTLPSFINSLSIYSFVLFLIISYGSIRLNTNFVPFYQQSVEDTFVEGLISFGCVTGQDVIIEVDNYIELTRKLADSGNKIILWSEGISVIMTAEKLNLLFDSIKNISMTYNAYIGFTYVDNSTQKLFNKQVVINNKGDVVIDYKKSNLVPFVEGPFTKGDNKLQTFQSEEFGIIGSAICFDFDFPKLIGQASTKKVNLMLDSSNTWVSPVGPLHARMNVIRSIENGFTTFRCNSYGVSGVWNQYGQPLHYTPTVNTVNTTTFQVPITMIKNRVKTVYSVFGETFGWICVGGIGVFGVLLIVMEKGSYRLRAGINNWL